MSKTGRPPLAPDGVHCLKVKVREPLAPKTACPCGCGFVQPLIIRGERIRLQDIPSWVYGNRRAMPITVNKRLRKLSTSHEQRARHLGVIWDAVDLGLVYRHHKGICGICESPVSADEVTIDHIVPLAKGGAHVWENLQLAHFSCNCQKSDFEDFVYGQTRTEASPG